MCELFSLSPDAVELGSVITITVQLVNSFMNGIQLKWLQ